MKYYILPILVAIVSITTFAALQPAQAAECSEDNPFYFNALHCDLGFPEDQNSQNCYYVEDESPSSKLLCDD